MIYPCKTCAKLKWHTDFYYIFKNGRYYRNLSCMKCDSKANKVYKKTYKKKHNISYTTQRARIKKSLHSRLSGLLWKVKKRSNSKKLNYNLDINWLIAKAKLGLCEVTGVKLNFEYTYTPQRTARAYGPSIDRKDPSKGYTKDNCQLVCWIYNRAKGISTHETVIEFAKALLRSECESQR